MKLGDIVRLEGVFGKMENTPMTMSKAKVFMAQIKPLKDEVLGFQEARQKGAQKYVKDGQTSIKPGDEGFEEFMSELQELINTEVGIDFESFDEKDFPDLVVTPLEMESIEKIGLFKQK